MLNEFDLPTKEPCENCSGQGIIKFRPEISHTARDKFCKEHNFYMLNDSLLFDNAKCILCEGRGYNELEKLELEDVPKM